MFDGIDIDVAQFVEQIRLVADVDSGSPVSIAVVAEAGTPVVAWIDYISCQIYVKWLQDGAWVELDAASAGWAASRRSPSGRTVCRSSSCRGLSATTTKRS
ncbi:MAG: hypothetical protein LC131_13620, partial [Anaerolineae bacterium]|nr:hypothetical protein [Anaerolineae bacterium]